MYRRVAAALSVLLTIVLLAIPTGASAQGASLHAFTSTSNPFTMRVPAGWKHLNLYGPGVFSAYKIDAWVDGPTTKGFHVNLLVFCMPAPYDATDGSVLYSNEQDALTNNGNVVEVGTALVADHLLTIMSTNDAANNSGDLQAYMVQNGAIWMFQVAARANTQTSWLPLFKQVFGTFQFHYTGED